MLAALSATTDLILVGSHGVRERRPPALASVLAEVDLPQAWVGDEVAPPLRVAYEDPRELGLDRRLAAYGAWLDCGAALVVDGGTALTLTHVDAQGLVRGLAIAAGRRPLQRALGEAAPALAPFIGDVPPHGLPRNSRENLAIGLDVAWLGGLAALVADAQRRLAEAGVEPGMLLFTGSDAARLCTALGRGCMSPGLVHRGLRELVV